MYSITRTRVVAERTSGMYLSSLIINQLSTSSLNIYQCGSEILEILFGFLGIGSFVNEIHLFRQGFMFSVPKQLHIKNGLPRGRFVLISSASQVNSNSGNQYLIQPEGNEVKSLKQKMSAGVT